MANLNISLLKKLPTDELIRQIELVCGVSPIISLLCDRLKELDTTLTNITSVVTNTTCPICLTEHEVIVVDEKNYKLEPKK